MFETIRQKWPKLFSSTFMASVVSYCCVYLIVYSTKSKFAGSKEDYFYYFLPEIQQIALTGEFPNPSTYRPAPNPLYVYALGMLSRFFGTTSWLFLVYFAMAILALYLLDRLLQSTSTPIRMFLGVAIASSGYFVAPSRWPTTDLPAYLFFILCIYVLRMCRFSTINLIVLSASSFALCSTRQSYSWIIVLIFYAILRQNHRHLRLTWVQALVTITPAACSVIFAFHFFGNKLSESRYLEIHQSKFGNIGILNLGILFNISMVLIVFVLSLILAGAIQDYKLPSLTAVLLITGCGLVAYLFGHQYEIVRGTGFMPIAEKFFNLSINFINAFGVMLILFILLIQSQKLFSTQVFAFTLFAGFSVLYPVPLLKYIFVPSLVLFVICIDPRHFSRSVLKTRFLFGLTYLLCLNASILLYSAA